MTSLDSVDRLHLQLHDMLKVVNCLLSAEDVSLFLAAGTALGASRHEDFIPWDFDVDVLIPGPQYERALAILREQLPSRYEVKAPGVDGAYEHLFGRVHLTGLHHKYAHIDLFPLVGTSDRRLVQEVHLRISRRLRQAFFLRMRFRNRAVPDRRLFRLVGSLLACLPARWFVEAFRILGRVWSYDRARTVTNLAAGYLSRECVPKALFMRPSSLMLRGQSFLAPSPIAFYLSSLYGDYEAVPSLESQQREWAKFEDWYLPALREVPLSIDEP